MGYYDICLPTLTKIFHVPGTVTPQAYNKNFLILCSRLPSFGFLVHKVRARVLGSRLLGVWGLGFRDLGFRVRV